MTKVVIEGGLKGCPGEKDALHIDVLALEYSPPVGRVPSLMEASSPRTLSKLDWAHEYHLLLRGILKRSQQCVEKIL